MRLLPSSFLARSLAALVASAVVLGVALVVDHDGGAGPAPVRAEPAGDGTPYAPYPRQVLRRWDDARSRAWAAGAPAALASLYTRGSVAGRRDVARLRAWRTRGWRVEGLRTQVGALRVVRDSPHVLVLLVADRVVGGTAVRRGADPVPLPHDGWDTRALVLHRHGERWRLASVGPARLGGAATLVR